MYNGLSRKFVIEQFNKYITLESIKHLGYHIKCDSTKENSMCIISESGKIDIIIATKCLYKHDYVSNDIFVQFYAHLYHELGHADTYTKINRKHHNGIPFTKMEKEIILDRMIGSFVPEYTVAVYYSNKDEILAEINSLNYIQRMSCNKHSIFNKLGIDAENVWLDNIKNRPIWYSQNQSAIRMAQSLQDCIGLLKSDLSANDLPVPIKLSKCTDLVLLLIEDAPISLLSEINSDFMTYLDTLVSKTELSNALSDVIRQKYPDIII